MNTTPSCSLGANSSAAAVALVFCCFASAHAFAQTPAQPPQGAEAAQEQNPAPADQPTSAAQPQEPEPEKEKFQRKTTFGFGPGFVFWPPQRDDPEDSYETIPALGVQYRRILSLHGVFGFEFSTDITFHDWKAIGDAYGWFFDKPSDESDEDWRAVKLGAGWPLLLLVPFGGANYQLGVGAIIFTSQSLPAVYFDAGFNMALWLRLSDPDFRADFGWGLYGGAGVDIFKSLGANVRVMWGAPLIHTFVRKTSGGITTVTFNLNFFH